MVGLWNSLFFCLCSTGIFNDCDISYSFKPRLAYWHARLTCVPRAKIVMRDSNVYGWIMTSTALKSSSLKRKQSEKYQLFTFWMFSQRFVVLSSNVNRKLDVNLPSLLFLLFPSTLCKLEARRLEHQSPGLRQNTDAIANTKTKNAVTKWRKAA